MGKVEKVEQCINYLEKVYKKRDMKKYLKNILLDKKISKKITKKDIILKESLNNNLTSNYQIEGPFRIYPVVFFKEYKKKIFIL